MMRNIIAITLVIVQVLILVESTPHQAAEKSVVKRDVNISCDCGLINSPYLEVLRGRDGRDGIPGRDGVKGERGNTGNKGERGEKGATGPPASNNGGVVYIRWGRTTCPNTGAELVYEGIAGGSSYSHSGGGANYLCLPKVPKYVSTISLSDYSSYLYGAEYQSYGQIISNHDHNVPCAVCYTSTKSTKLMIPANITCPTSWTTEYVGYLMAELYNHARNAVYECVDSSPQSIPGSISNTNGALFYFVQSTCTGLPCPPYVSGKAITCVVCTK